MVKAEAALFAMAPVEAPLDPARAAEALADFGGLAHRLQLVAEHGDLRFFNDSKATTPQATCLAVDAFDDAASVHVLAGGNDKKIDLSVDYVYSRAEGEYRIDAGQDAAPFPDLTTRLEGVRVRFNYPLRGGAELVVDYYNEQFRSSDWSLDGVNPDEVFNFLSLGEMTPRYNVDSVAVYYRTTF